MTRKRQFTREQYTTAARLIVQTEGAHNLSFQAVSVRLGASRGAITHNFPTKRHLVVAMIEDTLARAATIIEAEIAKTPDSNNPVFTGFIRAIADPSGQLIQLWKGMFNAGIMEDPPLTDLYTGFYERYWQRITAEVKDPVRAIIIWAALEGLELYEVYYQTPFTKEQRNAALQKLLEDAVHV
ncbi:TetR/AcrR family transcriptional regulator [Chitinophaga nivalis]|uniref:TetR/AcrR family transcriptional regulator n=1 Tax=Chitinophaga nivalis TaxID=2991709 RepID=A0ABT3IKC8_9BACT|nr:TetR/AcrR family transcriptional regulator [Chitinophaga nivalis]MCW3465938.1 TetR/AcrR family transcriptional regulator [Chitinophaga nivalis]MCW3484371.1 TetR/AcrR family transcriptional regulator [Chitinophaga nivalis]